VSVCSIGGEPAIRDLLGGSAPPIANADIIDIGSSRETH
jgi:hypothetical protein